MKISPSCLGKDFATAKTQQKHNPTIRKQIPSPTPRNTRNTLCHIQIWKCRACYHLLPLAPLQHLGWAAPACRHALKGAGSLSADMLQCRTAPASAAYQLKMIRIQPVLHIWEAGNICFIDRDDDTVMFQTSDLGSLNVHSQWAPKKMYDFKKRNI